MIIHKTKFNSSAVSLSNTKKNKQKSILELYLAKAKYFKAQIQGTAICKGMVLEMLLILLKKRKKERKAFSSCIKSYCQRLGEQWLIPKPVITILYD